MEKLAKTKYPVRLISLNRTEECLQSLKQRLDEIVMLFMVSQIDSDLVIAADVTGQRLPKAGSDCDPPRMRRGRPHTSSGVTRSGSREVVSNARDAFLTDSFAPSPATTVI